MFQRIVEKVNVWVRTNSKPYNLAYLSMNSKADCGAFAMASRTCDSRSTETDQVTAFLLFSSEASYAEGNVCYVCGGLLTLYSGSCVPLLTAETSICGASFFFLTQLMHIFIIL